MRGLDQQRVYELACAYREACDLVSGRWIALLRTPANTPERKACIATYNEARRVANLAHAALVDYARGDEAEPF